MTIDAIDNSGTIFFSHTITAHSERETFEEAGISGKADDSGILLVLFGTSDCEECTFIKNEFFPILEKKYRNIALVFRFINVDEDKHFTNYSALEKQLGNKKHSFPVVKIGNTLLSGEKLTYDNLDSLLHQIILDKEEEKHLKRDIGSTKNIITVFVVILLCIAIMLIIIKRRSKK